MAMLLKKVIKALKIIYFEIFCLFCCLVGLIKVKLLFSRNNTNRLEIGAGISKKKGMLSLDLDLKSDYPFDLRAGLPFPDDSIDFIYAEHVLEHFQVRDVVMLLAECKRVMKRGGVIRVAVPDARIYLNAYCQPDLFDYKSFCTFDTGLDYQWKINFVNYMFYMDGHHAFMFDEESLVSALESAGFVRVSLREFDAEIDQEVRKHESIYVQCEKI